VVALQEEATNHPRAAAVKSRGGERRVKRRAFERVRYDPMKANESEPHLKCRKAVDDIETKLCLLAWDEPGRCLLMGQAVSGMYAARAWVRLSYGTWEPVVSWDDRSVVYDLRSIVSGEVSSGRNREGRIPVARHRGGPARSSDEGPVMGLERRGRAIQTRSAVNREMVG